MTKEANDQQMEIIVEKNDQDLTDESVDLESQTVEVDADKLAEAAQNAGLTDSEQDEESSLDSDEVETVEDTDVKQDADLETENTEDEQPVDLEEPVQINSVAADDGTEVTVESVVEAILFACDEPITPNRLVGIVETGSVKQIKECVKNLNAKYEENNSSFRIEQIAGGFQMMTIDSYNHWLRKLIRVRADNKLTQAALETLAIIAYKQPIIRADVEAIRGVSSGEMIRSLMYKGLVRITGRAEVLGRPMLYGTTKKFLDVFGLNSAKDLPKIEELKKAAQ